MSVQHMVVWVTGRLGKWLCVQKRKASSKLEGFDMAVSIPHPWQPVPACACLLQTAASRLMAVNRALWW